MENLLFFLFWGGFIFLMMRFGCGAHVTGHRHGKHKPSSESQSGSAVNDALNWDALRWVAPETDTDPTCGKAVRTCEAKPSVHDGIVYYFCSRECREAFEAAPANYIGRESGARSQEMEGTHV